MLLKYSLLTINSSLNCCKDIFLHLKYFVYFNYFSTLFFINYIYYKFTYKLNIRLLNQLHYSINLNGCILIKFFQWIYTNINILTINNVENFDYLHILLGKFSENCPKHSIEYTKKIFKQDFNIDMDDVFDLDESYSIKSASVAQVYKAKLKNKSTNLHLNNFGNFDISNNIAIKIVHPELKYQKIMPMVFIKIYSFLTKYIYFIYKYIPYIDLDLFLKNLLNQFDMNNEYNNINYFYNIFIDNDYVLIPKPICCSKNILIMEFIDGEDFDNLDETELTKQKIVILLNLFIKYNFFISSVNRKVLQVDWEVKKNLRMGLSFAHNSIKSASPENFQIDYIDQNGNTQSQLTNVSTDLYITYSPGRFEYGFGVEQKMGSNLYPALIVNYRKGYKGLLGGTHNYDKIQLYQHQHYRWQ